MEGKSKVAAQARHQKEIITSTISLRTIIIAPTRSLAKTLDSAGGSFDCLRFVDLHSPPAETKLINLEFAS